MSNDPKDLAQAVLTAATAWATEIAKSHPDDLRPLASAPFSVIVRDVGGERPQVELFVGEQFIGAYAVLAVLIVVPLLAMISFPLPSMLYALDRPDGPFIARLTGMLVYLAVVAPLAWRFDLAGAAGAYVLGYATLVAVLIFQVWREYHRVKPGKASRPAEYLPK